MNRFCRILVLIVSLTSSSSLLPANAGLPANGTDTAFEAIYTAEWEWRNKHATPDEDTAQGQVPSQLPDVSAPTQEAKLHYLEDVLSQLKKLDPAALSAQRAIDYQIYLFQIETAIADQKFKTYQRPLSSDTSFWGDLAGIARWNFRSEEDYRNYIALLNSMPRYFQQNIANMRAGLERGFSLPQITLKGRDASVRSVIDIATPEDNPYFAPFRAMPKTLSAERQAELRREGLKAVNESVFPAHRELLQFLRDSYIPRAQTSIAACDLPDGKTFYQAQIKKYTTLDLSPNAIHAIGIEEVAAIRAEMLAVMHEVGFKGDLQSFLTFLRTDGQFYAKSPQALLERAAFIAKKFDGKAAQYFGRLPRQRFAIEPVPDDVAPFFTGGRGGPGIYLVNTYNLPARPLYTLPALTIHESAPGHAFQMPLAAENTDLPPFRRETFISAYGEGWALYSERLGDEMGIYETPYERFGMLSYQMWRAARLVVDTGIHAKGWTREQAQRYLHQNTALPDYEIATEVDRYIAWPGQALSYYLGEMNIRRNRQRAEAILGSSFNIRAFHDAILALGSVTLPVIDARVDRFIADNGKGPYPDEE